MAMMRTTTPGSLTGSLSASGTMSANITVGTVNMTAADMTNYYDKEEVDGLLENKSDVDHTHDNYVTNTTHTALKLRVASLENKIDKKADIEHTHEEYLTEHQDISGKADITYVDNAINTALNGIESQLDQIIGEEV